MKRLMWASLTVAIILGALAFAFPFPAGIIVAELAGSSFGRPLNPPALSSGLKFDAGMSHPSRTDSQWSKMLRKRFAAGSSEQDLKSVLTKQGFGVDGSHRFATYDWGGMPCEYTLRVWWHADAARTLKSIAGDYGAGCL